MCEGVCGVICKLQWRYLHGSHVTGGQPEDTDGGTKAGVNQIFSRWASCL